MPYSRRRWVPPQSNPAHGVLVGPDGIEAQGVQPAGASDTTSTACGEGLPQVLTVPEVARLLQLSRSKVYELAAKNELPVIRIGRSVRVSLADLVRWLEARRDPFSLDTCRRVETTAGAPQSTKRKEV